MRLTGYRRNDVGAVTSIPLTIRVQLDFSAAGESVRPGDNFDPETSTSFRH